jgi:NADH-quinone oxidoreductase subunit H
VPKFRFDQTMALGWKKLLPLSLINLFVTAFVIQAFA